MKPAILDRLAEAELDQAMAYYETQCEGLGLSLHAEVENALRRIERTPQLYSRHKETEYRRCVLRRFPFSLFYLELEERIWVAAVAHQKRRPDYWMGRSPE